MNRSDNPCMRVVYTCQTRISQHEFVEHKHNTNYKTCMGYQTKTHVTNSCHVTPQIDMFLIVLHGNTNRHVLILFFKLC